MSLTASTIMSVTTLPIVRAGDQCQKQFEPIVLHPVGMQLQLNNNRKSLRCSVQERRASIICAAALNARCAEGQTRTVTRESSTITVAPVQGKEKSPDLDDGGTGFPPRDDDGGGGGGGGGGGHWKGGFFFFGFLAFLGLLKDQEEGRTLPGPTKKMKQTRIQIHRNQNKIGSPGFVTGMASSNL